QYLSPVFVGEYPMIRQQRHRMPVVTEFLIFISSKIGVGLQREAAVKMRCKPQLQTAIKEIGQFFPKNTITKYTIFRSFYTDTSGIIKPLARSGYDKLYICVCIHRLLWQQRQYR
ncbi:MAG TPA: hypothetical protein VIO58_03170, partial [Candidatus Methanoperedens sp.]